MMKKRIFKNIEWGILICAILLITIGIVALYSATAETSKEELQRQLTWLILSIPIVIVVTCINYEVIAKISPIFYGIFLVLLVIVLFTEPVNGASSWFDIGVFSFYIYGLSILEEYLRICFNQKADVIIHSSLINFQLIFMV